VRTLAHISDLHFGRVDDVALDALRQRLRSLAPHLVVVSGDLTQRAKPEQFRQARDYLETLGGPRLVVPGNHDVPLYNPFMRFFRPLARYRRYISADPEPAFMDGEIAVVGVNSARSFVFKGGRIHERQLERVRKIFAGLGDAVTKILVAHHPFEEHLLDCGADVVLAGHLHASNIAGVSTLILQAGTATSSRTRSEPNSFNFLHVQRGEIQVERYALRGKAFERAAERRFNI